MNFESIITNTNHNVDLIVIGGGHAGIEAACAAARMGVNVIIVTPLISNIGMLSCNPAMGGIGKGTLIKEIDALDGLMGFITDQACIHYKTLNLSRGPAVWGPRAQVDRKIYRSAAYYLLHNYPNLKIIYASAQILETHSGLYQVVLSTRERLTAKAVVITTGTFLKGKMHVGNRIIKGGRIFELPARLLSDSIRNLGFDMGRLKTGTPPRILCSSINFDVMEVQRGDCVPQKFSELSSKNTQIAQVPCYITRTTEKTCEIVRNNIHKSPMYSGQITGIGPRYCPSIEDKIYKFPNNLHHQVFIEPEGLFADCVYPNGISTSLPQEVQDELVKSIPGLENAIISQYGYAVEYDFVHPRQLTYSLESKKHKGLFLAGQINGTTGYEEAGAQGIIAGINAALYIKGQEPMILDRSTSYIGVLIDDLINQDINEPYRMFTSRSEYRMSIRSDNADMRLTPFGISAGCVRPIRLKHFESKQRSMNLLRSEVQAVKFTPNYLVSKGYNVSLDGVPRKLYDLLGQQGLDVQDILKLTNQIRFIDARYLPLLSIEAKYALYVEQQKQSIDLFKTEHNIKLDKIKNYADIKGLSKEMLEKLDKVRPENIAAAKKIPGITPAAVLALIVYVKAAQHLSVD